MADGATPVLVEGALDAAAIDTLGHTDLVPLATCGTAVTTNQLEAIADAGALDRLVVGFDSDTAGRTAAVRLWPLLGPAAAGRAQQVLWSGAKDPGELVEEGKTETLAHCLAQPRPLALAVVDHLADTAIAPDAVEGRVFLLRAVAPEVVPTLNQEAITTTQDVLAARFGRTVVSTAL